jgi:hypothetical protein
MSEAPLEPLPAELAELLERERKGYVEDPAVKERVLRGVSRAVLFSLPVSGGNAGVPQAPTAADVVRSAAAPTTWTGMKVMAAVGAAFLAGGVSGVLVSAQWRTPHKELSPAIVGTQATVGVPAPSVPVGPPDDSALLAPSASSSSSSSGSMRPTPSAAGASSERTGSVAREREVLDAARAALSHGRWSDALSAVHEHETRWPHGALSEEREVLAIRALAASGQTAAACTRAARFHRGFPKSMLSDGVSSALANAGCAESPEP